LTPGQSLVDRRIFPLLKDKVALVTGAGSGIGRAGAIAMAQHGATVIVTEALSDNTFGFVCERRRRAPCEHP